MSAGVRAVPPSKHCRSPRIFAAGPAIGALLAAAVLLAPRPAPAAAPFWRPRDFGANFPGRIVAIGDSITEGFLGDGTCANPGCDANRPYPAALQILLQARRPGVTVLNRGRGGETTEGGAARLPSVLSADRPGFVLIMEGTNDATFRQDPDQIVENLRMMIRLTKANASKFKAEWPG